MKFSVRSIDLFERDVRLRMPFRFGIVTLTESPQAFARARIRLENGAESEGAAAELLAPKWFDKNPALTNEQNFEQLRLSLALARSSYLSGGSNSAFGHFRAHHQGQIDAGGAKGLNPLTSNYGPALIDRAVLDALCRALGISFYDAVRRNVAGLDLPRPFLESLRERQTIAARHTVGLVDPITTADIRERVNDGLPETLDEVVARYGHRWFKLKVAGDARADVERLSAIASVLDRIAEPYHASLDGNEQYEDVAGLLELWRRMKSEPRLRRLVSSIVFFEQPIKRQKALAADVSELSKEKPVIIDESDDLLDAFVRAKALGYRGVSSKTCKGIYRSLINAARCAEWGPQYFMSGEDLTIQAGLALQQDLALVSLLGLTHVERNGHHYVNGMADLPAHEQEAFLKAHPDLYERSHGAVRVRITDGNLAIRSLACHGYATGATPEWAQMREMKIK
ncbi:MAG TPA: enolase C-terminal domain-like protein [Burkholderiales bacterium]